MQNVKLFIAARYLIAKKNINAVNTITFIAIFAISVATAAMFIILSTFSGLEKFNLSFHNTLNPDIEISAKKGKILPNINLVTQLLDKQKEVAVYSKTILEKAYVTYGEKNDITKLKAVDYNFRLITPIDSLISYGKFFEYDINNQALLGNGVTYRLSVLVDNPTPLKLYLPKPGEGLITSEEEAFNIQEVNPIGILGLNDQLQDYVYVPLQMGQSLLNLSAEDAYTIEVKLKPNASLEEAKEALSQKLPKNIYEIKTRYEQDASFIKVMNTEKMMIYLIFSLVLFITTFNLSGAIIILILDKKTHIAILSSLGLEMKSIRQIFFYIGLIISFLGLSLGLFLGSIISLLQKKYSLVMANAYVPFPIEFTWQNYVFIILLVLFLGSLASYVVSGRVYIKNLKGSNFL